MISPRGPRLRMYEMARFIAKTAMCSVYNVRAQLAYISRRNSGASCVRPNWRAKRAPMLFFVFILARLLLAASTRARSAPTPRETDRLSMFSRRADRGDAVVAASHSSVVIAATAPSGRGPISSSYESQAQAAPGQPVKARSEFTTHSKNRAPPAFPP